MTATLHDSASTQHAPTRTPGSGHFVAGVRAITPMVVSVAPFGLAIGGAAAASGLDTPIALASAPLVFAGAAQLTAIQMLDAGVAPAVIILSALMINARIMMYSASLAPWFRGESLGRRLLLAIPVIDQLHFMCVPRFEAGDLDRAGRVAFYSGAALWLTTAWTLSTGTAVLIGARVPEAVGLHVAAPLALAGLLARALNGRAAHIAAAIAATVAVVGVGLPFRAAVLVAALTGIGISSGLDRQRPIVGDHRADAHEEVAA